MSIKNFALVFSILAGLFGGFTGGWGGISPAAAAVLHNQMKNHPSPYLAMHGEDPVAWQEWNPATIELARKQGKLLFVSIGYFSCHWCHVMQGESYRNAEIAALINRHFIPVKVDRELEGALDAEMIAFTQQTLGSAGWPLNVFITPEGYPLYSVLYEKPERFYAVLDVLGSEWLQDSAGLMLIAQKSAGNSRVTASRKIKPTARLAEIYRARLLQETLQQADMLSGGINTPRKFPLSPQLLVLLEMEARQHHAKFAEWLQLTLEQMARGGLRDHVAGGFFRYTVDPSWHTPHFEKMLYDNAQLAVVYLRAARIFNKPAYRDIAIETLDFMLDEMRSGDAFVTSMSALDEHGREGAAYLWNVAQLRQVVEQDEYALLEKIWGMGVASEFESGYLPVNKHEPEPAELARLKDIYAKLSRLRKDRVVPRDGKLMAGLNGLALAAFSEASDIAPRYRQAAERLQAFMRNRLWVGGSLHKGVSNQQLLGAGDLESYAYTAAGLLQYARISGKQEDIEWVRKLAESAWGKFHGADGFVLQERSDLARPYHQAVVEDSPVPSPSSMLILSSLKSGEATLRKYAENALAEGGIADTQDLFWYATQVAAFSQLFTADSRLEQGAGKKMPLNQRGRSGAKKS